MIDINKLKFRIKHFNVLYWIKFVLFIKRKFIFRNKFDKIIIVENTDKYLLNKEVNRYKKHGFKKADFLKVGKSSIGKYYYQVMGK